MRAIYRLLIVEDEEKIRNGLCKLIDWHSMGFLLVENFASALEVLDYLEQGHVVDVILSDILMEPMTGLELAKVIAGGYPKIKLVFLTAHQSFEYAKQAISWGVVEYLTKPIKLDELLGCFNKIALMLDEETAHDRMVDNWGPYIREKLLFDLAMGGIRSHKQLQKSDSSIQIFPFQEGCRAVLLQIMDSSQWHYDMEKLYRAIITIVKDGDYGLNCSESTCTSPNQLLFLLPEAAAKLRSLCLEEMLANCAQTLQDTLSITARLVASDCIYDPLEMPAAYVQVQTALFGSAAGQQAAGQLQQHLSTVTSYLFQGDREAVRAAVTTLFELLACSPHRWEQTLRCMKDIWQQAQTIEDALPHTRRELSAWWDGTLDSAQIAAESLLTALADHVAQNQAHSGAAIVEKTKRLIDENYQQDITLSLLAGQVYVSPPYLSKLFKEYTDQNFIDYLTTLRIDKAKQLLLQGYKVYEVALLVGYSNHKYFSRVFKHNVGCSPSDYQKGEVG